MFKTLRIGPRLGTGFAFVLRLVIIISALAYTRVGSITHEINDMVADKFPKTVWANDIVDQVNAVASATRNALLLTKPEDSQRELDRIPPASKIISERMSNNKPVFGERSDLFLY